MLGEVWSGTSLIPNIYAKDFDVLEGAPLLRGRWTICGNWLVLFEPLNSVTTWKQAAARNVWLGMTEPTRLFQFETDAPYERLMLDRLASRETSQQMIKAVLGEDILRKLGMLPKQSPQAMGESGSQDKAAERAGTSNLYPGRRALGIGSSPNPSDLRQSLMATAGVQRIPPKAVTPTEEFLDRVEDFLAGRTEEGFDRDDGSTVGGRFPHKLGL